MGINYLSETGDLMLHSVRKSASRPPNMSDGNVSCAAPATRHAYCSCRPSSNVPRLPSFLNCCKARTFGSLLWRCRTHCACHEKWRFSVQKRSENGVLCMFWLGNQTCFAPQRRALFQQHNFPKCPRMKCFNILTWKRTSRHSRVHFFNSSTSKSAPTLRGFCILTAPQPRAIFDRSSRQVAPHPPL